MSLVTSMSASDLTIYVARQLNHQYPGKGLETLALEPLIPRALERVEHCFTHIRTKYYFRGGSANFSHLMGDQYASFLYFLSREAHFANNSDLASKVYGLNKSLHGIDVYYEVRLPDIFCFQHTVGTVLGRADYSDYLFVYQRVTVGGDLQLRYPRIGKGVVLFGGVSVVGDAQIGDNVFLSINTTCNAEKVNGNAMVFGQSPQLIVRPTGRSVIAEMFHRIPYEGTDS